MQRCSSPVAHTSHGQTSPPQISPLTCALWHVHFQKIGASSTVELPMNQQENNGATHNNRENNRKIQQGARQWPVQDTKTNTRTTRKSSTNLPLWFLLCKNVTPLEAYQELATIKGKH